MPRPTVESLETILEESVFTQDDEITPVLFRVHRAPKTHGGEVIAVFPCEPANYVGYAMTCYVHVGQHGLCDHGWYNRTRPATPAEYADLKEELESAPYGYRFRVYRRMQPFMRDRFKAVQDALRAGPAPP